MKCIWCKEELKLSYEIRRVSPNDPLHDGYLCRTCAGIAMGADELVQLIKDLLGLIEKNLSVEYLSAKSGEVIEDTKWWGRTLGFLDE